MINLLYEPFPTTVTIEKEQLSIVTDFREWLKFADLLRDESVPDRMKFLFLSDLFLNPPLRFTERHFKALLKFYHASDLEDTPVSDHDQETTFSPPLFDWKFDAKYILADFRRYYQIDLIHVNYLHWFEFRSLFDALPDDSTCQQRITYRGIDPDQIKNLSERKRIKKIQKQIAIPYTLTDEMIGEAFTNAF